MKPISMLRTSVLIFFVAGLAAAQEAPAKVQFAYRAPAVGETRGHDLNGKIDINIEATMGAEVVQAQTQSQKFVERSKKTIIESTDGRVAKVRVTYDNLAQEFSGDNVEMAPPFDGAVLVGKTYLVTFADGQPAVTTDEGAEVSQAEVDAVRKREGDAALFTGWGPDFREVIPEREVAVGETFKIVGAKALGLLPGTEKKLDPATVKATADLTLVGTKRILGAECGVFDVSLDISGTPPGDVVAINVKAKGQLLVVASTMALAAIDIEGPIGIAGEVESPGAPAPVVITGAGTMKFKGSALFGKSDK